MKKLLLKLLVLVFVIWATGNMVFYTLRLPRFWGVCYDRLHFYQANADKYNTLFIGSSLTRYQVNPVLFDSINAQDSVKTISCNFGVDGACPTELFSTYKYLLNNKPVNLKYVFVELTLIDNFDKSQLHTLRRKSSFDFEQYRMALPLTLQSNYDWKEKADILWFDLSNLIEGSFKINMLQDAISFRKKRAALEKLTSVQGFVALSTDDPAKGIDPNGKLGDRHKIFLAESLPQLEANTQAARNMFTVPGFLTTAKADKTYICMVAEMLAEARQKGVELIFVLPPRLSAENYEDLLPVYSSIPTSNRIELADPDKYPDFYKVKYSYDIKHINKDCVPIYTAALANDFLTKQCLKR